jgi:hypothetical protein
VISLFSEDGSEEEDCFISKQMIKLNVITAERFVLSTKKLRKHPTIDRPDLY